MPRDVGVKDIVLSIIYIIICICGFIGNGLVIYVILCYAKMKTVTNMYILNLAISDALFLVSLPFLVTTMLIKYWIFGNAMCKIYYVLYSINFFSNAFILMAMSADRYLAVCHPVRSVQYRSPRIAFFVCLGIWTVSFFVMLPIILYSTTTPHTFYLGKETCHIAWPEGQLIPPEKAFTWYTFLLGFAIPVALISVFYISVVMRLRHVGPAKKSKEKRKTHRKVTTMVLTVVAVYIICWLPHWVFQVDLTFRPPGGLPAWVITMFSIFTALTYTNSMLNPLLYAFLSDHFRRSFMKAFRCNMNNDPNRTMCAENSIFPRHGKKGSKKGKGKDTEKYEFTTVITNAEATSVHNPNTMLINHDESTFYVDKEIQTKGEEE